MAYLRANLRFDTFGINSATKFLRFGEMPSEITTLLREWKIVYGLRFDKRAGPFHDTVLLYVKEGSAVPRILKAIRKNWVRIKGRYIRKANEEALMEQELTYFVNLLHSKGHANIIVAGDFNRPLEDIRPLAHSLRLEVAQSDYHATHINRESDNAETSQTDYILCSVKWSNTRSL